MHETKTIIQKTLTACIIGKPNAGKSSLLNKIIGQKISIVTPKVQTTRCIITGIVTINDTQIIMFDTPGLFEPRKNLERAMVRCAWSSLNAADLVLLVIDHRYAFDEQTIEIFKKLRNLNINPVFIFNKLDLKPRMHNNDERLKEYFDNPVVFKLSALTGKSLDELLAYFTNISSLGEWSYSEDEMTTSPVRFLASEITREQLFLRLQEELPYNITVQSEKWEERDESVVIHHVIVVTNERHKQIILGTKGTKIKELGINARLEIEKLLDKKVHLFLFVKVRPEWQNNKEFYDYMGLQLQRV